MGVFGTVIDLGVLGEYHYDDRGDSAATVFNDDIGMGARLAFNDAQSSQALIGMIIDRDNGGKFFNIEASRRLGNHWLLELQGRFLFDIADTDPAFSLHRDDYLELFLSYYF